MANDRLTISTGCRDGESLCRVTLPEQGNLALTLDGVPCKTTDGGYQCGDRFLPETAPRALTWLPGTGRGTLAGSQRIVGIYRFGAVIAGTLPIPKQPLLLPEARGSLSAGWRDRLLRHAEAVIAALPNPVEQVQGFLAIAAGGGAPRLIDRAIAIADSIDAPDDQSIALGKIAEALASARRYAQALAFAHRIPTQHAPFKKTLQQVAEQIAAGGDYALALRVADSIPDGPVAGRKAARGCVAVQMAKGGAFRAALEVVRRTGRELGQDAYFSLIAAELARAGRVVEAIAVGIEGHGYTIDSGNEGPPYTYVGAHNGVIAALAEGGRLDRALRIAGLDDRGVVDPDVPEPTGVGDEGMRAIVTALARRGDFVRARELMTRNPFLLDGESEAVLSGTIARYMVAAGQRAEGLKLFDEAVRLAKESCFLDKWKCAWAHREIVAAMAEAGQFARARRLALTITDAESRSEALARIAAASARVRRFDEAVAIAEGIERPVERARVLAMVATVKVAPPPRPAKVAPIPRPRTRPPESGNQ